MKICLKCPKSSEDFKNERSFAQHEKTHKEATEPCPECNKLFRSKNDVSSHRNRVHSDKNYFTCNHCDVEFSKKSNLKRHLEKVNRDNGSQEDPGVVNNTNILFKCPDCNKKERDDILEIIGHKMFSCAVL